MSEPLLPYNPEAKCAECGFADVCTTYHPPQRVYDADGRYEMTRKYHSRCCRRCGCQWREACLPDDERSIGEIIEELGKQVAKEEWAKVPRDLTTNLDDYLYGGKAMSEDGGPAFPKPYRQDELPYYGGMSLRDWFAGMAMQGLSTREGWDVHKDIATDAYGIAGAMLAESRRETHDEGMERMGFTKVPVDAMDAMDCCKPKTDEPPEVTHRRMRGVESSE
jgi:hypothetical protein